MLLTVDVGNTQTVLGLWEGEEIVARWRVATQRHIVSDELAIMLDGLLALYGHSREQISATVVSSTVPSLVPEWMQLGDRHLSAPPLVVGPGLRSGMPVLTDNPREVGPDRLANSVAALARRGAPCIVVDFGTSTNFDVVSAGGEFVGGAIAPGVEVSMEALFSRAARLLKVDLAAPRSAIGKTTVASMQSGAVFGFAGLVDGLVRRIRADLEAPDAPTIATGGLAPLILPHAETLDEHCPDLTLEGLRLIYERNR